MIARLARPLCSLCLLATLAAGAARVSAASPARSVLPAPLPGAANCPIFPASNVWNRDISRLPVAANSAALLRAISPSRGLHPDFSAQDLYGIPFNVVGGTQKKQRVSFDYADESDRGPYPIPTHPRIEDGGDAHMLIVDASSCVLYELYGADHQAAGWHAGSGAIWNLRSNALRTDGWTSADAAGLPILPGLVRYDEVAAGVINHALRFTAPRTRTSHIYPARHDASHSGSASLPPMGLRVRLKASTNISWAGPQTRAILVALKKYGMLLADNGSPFYVSGAPDARWNDDQLHLLNRITASDLEVVDTRGLVNGK